MNLKSILIRLLTILQIITFSQNSHVQQSRLRIHDDLKDDSLISSSDSWPLSLLRNHQHKHHNNQYHNHHRLHHRHRHHHRPHHHCLHRQQPHQADGPHITYRWFNHHNRWSGRRGSFDKHHFTAWTMWTGCGNDCVRRRERYCKVKRKCGHTKQLEEQECWSCQSHVQLPVFEEVQRGSISEQATSNYARMMTGELDDFHILDIRKPNYKKKRKPIFIDVDDYATTSEVSAEKTIGNHPVHSLSTRRKSERHPTERNLLAENDGIDGDIFQYEDFDFESDLGGAGNHYSDSYENIDYGFRNTSLVKERATSDALIPRHRRIYSKWSRWTKCSPKCTTRRYKKCRMKEHCGREVLREIAYCYTEGSFCQQWLQAQVQKSSPFDLRPVSTTRRREISTSEDPESNAIVSDFIMNGKGYRGPEYTPLKLKCGIASIHKRNLYNMLKIIGGKAARKGEWPWQVAIFNRFKEAFCGGTLIAPQWVLTAAHCVRKVLYVRLGEHNLDHHDGTELQLRVVKSYKHPNFDKKTVDSDVALLRLPQSTNTTTWIGFSCLPRPYQPLPRNVDCTVIGWGKRRNRDVAGTSVLHQAEVPIIPMENCRSVYHDYTITKNMFCAGHKRGRIDTCAGDSGGPLLCRDTTKPNHPWTIFGITSFGDGCAKRNKFGIYAKVPNYVDWAWSVINCNGNCKLHQRS